MVPIGAAGRAYNRPIPSQEAPMADATSSKQMKEFAGLYYREGALDPKTMQLVALAAMAAAGCTS
jgi:alkylhydroperoxidase/carboxymuconolactone decarboxylase family protein YurZ